MPPTNTAVSGAAGVAQSVSCVAVHPALNSVQQACFGVGVKSNAIRIQSSKYIRGLAVYRLVLQCYKVCPQRYR